MKVIFHSTLHYFLEAEVIRHPIVGRSLEIRATFVRPPPWSRRVVSFAMSEKSFSRLAVMIRREVVMEKPAEAKPRRRSPRLVSRPFVQVSRPRAQAISEMLKARVVRPKKRIAREH